MPKVRGRRGRPRRYRSLTEGNNGLKVTKGNIPEAFKKTNSKQSSAAANPDLQNEVEEEKEETAIFTEEEKEEILRQFDLDWRFGPSIGISRQERWTRAEKLGQDPPERVERILKGQDRDSPINRCLWSAYKLI